MGSKFKTTLDKQNLINGNFTSKSDIHIDGEIKGNIVTNGNVFMGENSKVQGNIKSHCIDIHGTFEGDLTASKKISLSPTAQVNGNLHYTHLSIEQGASFKGKCILSE
ncbi:MAG: polymer-forming cytoskeletal protein [Flavobacteriaceae bacterium]|nr:polymer-forming cytoskeletal protein [Flavobacteriaceae bacterium]